MKNIYLLPTDKPSILHLYTDENGTRPALCELEYSHTRNTQNIYITSDEEIKDRDWFIALDGSNDIYKTNKIWLDIIKENTNPSQKIILTTDQDLIKDGVQAIDDEFLEWFVENPSCEEVDVKKLKSGKYWLHEAIIPKEEPYNKVQQKSLELNKKFAENNDLEKIMSEFDELKQETPEEVADRFFEEQEKLNFIYDSRESFAEGYKLAQEQDKKMYNEKEVKEILKLRLKWFGISINEFEDNKWFEQFKK